MEVVHVDLVGGDDDHPAVGVQAEIGVVELVVDCGCVDHVPSFEHHYLLGQVQEVAFFVDCLNFQLIFVLTLYIVDLLYFAHLEVYDLDWQGVQTEHIFLFLAFRGGGFGTCEKDVQNAFNALRGLVKDILGVDVKLLLCGLFAADTVNGVETDAVLEEDSQEHIFGKLYKFDLRGKFEYFL